jgi:hypothetical protein
MGKQLSRLQKKKAAQDAAELNYKIALSKAKQAQRDQEVGQQKRKEVNDLIRYIGKPYRFYATRPADAFRTRTYSLERQIRELLKHLWMQYPVPECLIGMALSVEGYQEVYGRDRPAYDEKTETLAKSWFCALATGQKFGKGVAKGYLTKIEAHHFTLSPSSLDFPQAIFYAKARGSGVEPRLAEMISMRVGQQNTELIGERLPEFLRFFAVHRTQMRRGEEHELLDFLVAAMQDRTFQIRGRTLNSVRRLSTRWHQQMRWYGGLELHWAEAFERMSKPFAGGRIEFVELTTGMQLMEEGLHQSHCVGSYARSCHGGFARIVSARFGGSNKETPRRVTIEIFPEKKSIVQIRTKCNALPNEKYLDEIKLWAKANNLTIEDWAAA